MADKIETVHIIAMKMLEALLTEAFHGAASRLDKPGLDLAHRLATKAMDVILDGAGHDAHVSARIALVASLAMARAITGTVASDLAIQIKTGSEKSEQGGDNGREGSGS